MLKKFISIFIIFLLLFFIGCGSNNSKQTNKAGSNETKTEASNISQESSNNELSNVSQGAPSQQNINSSVSIGTEKSAKLPKDYPSDKFPLYEGSFISTVTELDGGYILTAFSKDEVNKVITFYNKVLQDAKIQMDTKAEDSLTSFGTKSGFTYNLDVGKSSEMKGYQTVITISLQPLK